MMKLKQRQEQYPKTIALSADGIDPFQQLAGLPAGGMFIVRHYATPDRATLAGDLLSAARAQRRKLRVLIAGDVRLAHRLAADGVHYPEWQICRQRRIARLKPHWHISAAAHSWLALRRAALAGVDFALLSPIFETAKTPRRAPLGLCRFARSVMMAQKIGLPVYALGGITMPDKARRLRASGIAGWAGTRAFALNAFSD